MTTMMAERVAATGQHVSNNRFTSDTDRDNGGEAVKDRK